MIKAHTTSTRLRALTLLLVAATCSTVAGIVLWYEGDQLIVRVSSAVAGGVAVVLTFVASRAFASHARPIRAIGIVLGIPLCAGAIVMPTLTDRGSWNEAAKAGHILKKLAIRNEQYATLHNGNFASDLGKLGGEGSIGRSYRLTYEPIPDGTGAVRRYRLRAAPVGTYWINLYADETGVVRFNSSGPADRDSPRLF